MNNHTLSDPLYGRVERAIHQRGILPAQSTVVVAVSGGQDSVCLLKILAALQSRWGWRLTVAHLDHGWRADSAQVALGIQKLAHEWALPFYSHRADLAPRNEAAARTWRYEWLGSLAQRLNATQVVTGHTATDRGETLLLNLLRGSAMTGLGSLDWTRVLGEEIRLIRPLLAVSREETGAFCQRWDLPVWIDPTNFDLNYARNRVRLTLLPYLGKYFNPQTSRLLAQTAEILAAEDDYLAQVSQEYFQKIGTPQGLDRQQLKNVPLALQRRVIRQWIGYESGQQGTFRQIEEIRSLLEQPTGSRTSSLIQGASAQVRGDYLVWVVSR